ncbi:hypothetical protein C8T65DRAFT_734691 [Cerioporus squamosus]|nr:hypothetical protein C8T65DRAFT_734691 [Cerioporus squamosus]
MGRLQALKDRIRIRTRDKSSSSKSCTVDHIPVELLESIFRLACSDGGATGCSLSQVSKRFRAIARTGRFDSVALRSGCAGQVAQFTSCLAAERERAGPASSLVKVRHLFLASAIRQIRRNHPGAKEELVRYQRDISGLMELVAPDLHTLLLLSSHMSWEDELRFPDIGLRSYPELRELSLYGCGSRFAPITPFQPTWEGLDYLAGTDDLASYPQLPQLVHLHICDPGYVFAHSRNLSHWGERAPGLTHLCLSNWKRHHRFVENTAADVVGLPDRPPLFEHLEVFIVQADASPPPLTPAPSSIADIPPAFFDTLEELRDLQRRSTCRWALVPPFVRPADDRQVYAHAAKQEWACWEAGLPGCWAVDESYFNPVR